MIQKQLITDIETSLKALGITDPSVILQNPARPEFGDYATNVALRYSKELKMNPVELAEQIVKHLPSNTLIKKTEVIKPGFINFHLTNTALIDNLVRAVSTVHYGRSDMLKGKKIIVEYTDPNPFKEFHIGHLYSNIVGESLARFLESNGAEIKRVCYQGDVGMHVAKSIWGMMHTMKEENTTLEDLAQKSLEDRVSYMGKAYALGASKYEEDQTAKEEMQKINLHVFIAARKLWEHKEDFKPFIEYEKHTNVDRLLLVKVSEIYKAGRQWTLDYFEKVYARLGTQFNDYYFESEVSEYGAKLVFEYLKKGVFVESKGAIVFPGEDHGLHTRVFINSLGLPTYETKELGLAPTKYRRFPYDVSIIVTGNEINEYFKVLLKALSLINPDLAAKTKHISHGMVRLPEGKMSSRTGNIKTGESLLNEASARAEEKMKESATAGESKTLAPETIEKVGTGAVKYALLKNSIGNNVEFNFNESVSFEGNSGPYLQYTFVRCISILNKFANTEDISTKTGDINFVVKEEELAILRRLVKFEETVVAACQMYSPNIMCNYLYELAQEFNLFYQKHSILNSDSDTKEFRLLITRAVARILHNGLFLLGIETVEKM